MDLPPPPPPAPHSLLDVSSLGSNWIQHSSSDADSPISFYSSSPAYSPSTGTYDDLLVPPPPIVSSCLPTPSVGPDGTFIGPDPSLPPKKSHARRQPPGHVPRPRNAFILFRCDFVGQKKVPSSVESDHRNISRIAGRVWQGMDAAQRAPWVRMASREKMRHKEMYPDYRYQKQGEKGKEEDRRKGRGRRRASGTTRTKESGSEDGVWEVVTDESMREELEKGSSREPESQAKEKSSRTSRAGPSSVPSAQIPQTAASHPSPTAEPSSHADHRTWSTEETMPSTTFEPFDGATTGASPTDTVLFSQDEAWANSYSTNQYPTAQVQEQLHLPSSTTAPSSSSSSPSFNTLSSSTLYHPEHFPHLPNLVTSCPSNGCVPLHEPEPSQNYHDPAFDWHITTGSVETPTAQCSEHSSLPVLFDTSLVGAEPYHQSQYSSYTFGNGYPSGSVIGSMQTTDWAADIPSSVMDALFYDESSVGQYQDVQPQAIPETSTDVGHGQYSCTFNYVEQQVDVPYYYASQ